MDHPDVEPTDRTVVEGQKSGRQFTLVELIVLFFMWIMFSGRLISLPLLIPVIWFWRPNVKWYFWMLALLVFCGVSLSPIDIDIPELSTSHSGKPQVRIGLVRNIGPGEPAHNLLLTRYGEYYHRPIASWFGPPWILSFSIGRIVAQPQLERERQIVAEIRQHHGTFEVDESKPDKPVTVVRFWPMRDESIDSVLERLSGLKELQQLVLHDESITDATLKHIQELTQLRSLVLRGVQVTDVGLQYVSKLIALQELRLNVYSPSDRITNVDLTHLEQLKRLQQLEIIGAEVSDASLDRLRHALPNCKIEH